MIRRDDELCRKCVSLHPAWGSKRSCDIAGRSETSTAANPRCGSGCDHAGAAGGCLPTVSHRGDVVTPASGTSVFPHGDAGVQPDAGVRNLAGAKACTQE